MSQTTTDTTRHCVEGARLCKPKLAPGPSGVHLRHSLDCPDTPGERIHHPKGRTLPPRGWRGTR